MYFSTNEKPLKTNYNGIWGPIHQFMTFGVFTHALNTISPKFNSFHNNILITKLSHLGNTKFHFQRVAIFVNAFEYASGTQKCKQTI